jgi:cell division protein FtsQ
MTPPSAEVLHPARLVARRREVRRARVARIRRLVLGFVAACLLGYGGWAITHSSLFALDGIQISGLEHITRSQIMTASGVRLGMNVLSVNTGSVIERIESLPFVASARVERVYPSKLRIVVTERIPVAVVELPNDRWLIDGTGIALVPVGETDGLPIVRSASGDEVLAGSGIGDAGVLQALAIWRGLPAAWRGGVSSIEATSPVAVTVHLGDANVVFGDSSDLATKVAALRALLARAQMRHATLLAADLRAPQHPAARFSA